LTSRPRGRVSFATVPFEEHWYHRLLHPIAIVTNALMTAWMYPSWRTAKIRWAPSYEELIEHAREVGRSIIFYSWHEYEPLIFLAFRDIPQPLKAIAIGHDGLLSRMLQRTGARLGFHIWIYRRRSPIRPKDQIIDLIRSRMCHIGLIPDAGGPYRKIKPGIAEIARATNALVVPLVPVGHPSLTFRWPKPFRFPLPFSSVVVQYGAPLDGATVTVEMCQIALETLEESVRGRGTSR